MEFFGYSKLVWKGVAKISSAELQSLNTKHKEKEEKETLGVDDLVKQSNEAISLYQSNLKELPARFSAELKKYIVNYFLSSAKRFDKDTERGLDKIEFGKYKEAMLSRLFSILKKYVPSHEQIDAHKKQKEKIEKAAKKLEEQSLMENDDFDTKDLDKPKRIQTELKKINSQSIRLQKETKGGFDAAAELIQKINEYNSLSAYSKAYGSGPQWKINMKVRFKPAVQSAKDTILKSAQERQKSIAKHGELLITKGEELKKKLLDAREIAYKKVEKRADAKKKKNETMYNRLKKRKEKMDRLAGFEMDRAVRHIDRVLNDPVKYGLNSDAVKKLIEQRRLIVQGKNKKTDGSLPRATKEIKGAMRILEAQQLSYGSLKEQIAAKFLPMIDRVDNFNEALSTHIFETNLDNLKLVSNLEKSINTALNMNLKGYSKYDAVTGGITEGISLPFKVISAGLSRARNIKYLGKVLGPVGDFVGGAIESVGDIASGVVTMVLHPVQTYKGVTTLLGRDPKTGKWHSPFNTDYNYVEKGWMAVWRAGVAADEFQNGKYAKGTGRIVGNFFTAVLSGGGAGSLKAVGAARFAARTSVKLGLKGTLRAIGRGIRNAPGALARGVANRAVRFGERVRSVGRFFGRGAERTVDISKSLINWNSEQLGKIGDIYKSLKPRVRERLSGLRDSYNEFSGKVAEKIRSGKSRKEAVSAAAKENPSLYARAKDYLRQLKERAGERVRGRKTKEAAGKPSYRAGEIYRNAKESVKLRGGDAVRNILGWNSKQFGRIGEVYKRLAPKVREKLSGLRESYRQFRDKVVEKIQSGKTPKEAAASAARENPSLYARAKDYIRQLKERAGERVRGRRKARAEKSRLRDEQKGARAEARRAQKAEKAEAAEKARANKRYQDLKFEIGDEVKIMKDGKLEDGWRIALDDGDMVVLHKKGVGSRRARKSSILEHNKKGPFRKSAEAKKASEERRKAEETTRIQSKYDELKFEVGDEIMIKKDGKLEDGWRVALDAGDVIFVKKGSRIRRMRKSSVIEHNKKGPLRKGEDIKKAKAEYKRLKFEKGDEIRIERSDGSIEDGWRIKGNGEPGSERIVVYKEGVGTRSTSYENITRSNPKGPRIKARDINPRGATYKKGGRKESRSSSSGEFTAKASAEKQYRDLGFEDGDVVKVRRHDGTVDGNWRISGKDYNRPGRVWLYKEGVGTRSTSYENILHNNPKGPRVKAKVEADFNRLRYKKGDRITIVREGTVEHDWVFDSVMKDGSVRVVKPNESAWMSVSKENVVSWNKHSHRRHSGGAEGGSRAGAGRRARERSASSPEAKVEAFKRELKTAEGLTDIQRAKLSGLKDSEDIVTLIEGMDLMQLKLKDLGKMSSKELRFLYHEAVKKYHPDRLVDTEPVIKLSTEQKKYTVKYNEVSKKIRESLNGKRSASKAEVELWKKQQIDFKSKIKELERKIGDIGKDETAAIYFAYKLLSDIVI